MDAKAKRQVAWWLLIGVGMIYFQIVIGGITRLTGSGLSITKWEIITGAVPPLHETAWQAEFDKYRSTPQYQLINKGMTLSEFKFIYFWEYFHRLWARLMGVVFAIPFAVFLFQKKLPPALIRKLIVLILLASLVASFGWIMVMSGLTERPWVDAYKLTMHLSLALITYGYLLWLFFTMFFGETYFTAHPALKKSAFVLLAILSFQLVLGGLMSGMRAGFLYPTFPDMNGSFIPDLMTDFSNWSFSAFYHYDTDAFAPTVIQLLHRATAFIFLAFAGLFFFRAKRQPLSSFLSLSVNLLAVITVMQIVLGILTVLNFKGQTPVLLGVLHQAVGILLLTAMMQVYFLLGKRAAKQ